MRWTMRHAQEGNPSRFNRMHHADRRENITILTDLRMHYSCTPPSLLLQSVFISKLFPGHFGSTRNNSKCFFVSPDFSPNRGQRYEEYSERQNVFRNFYQKRPKNSPVPDSQALILNSSRFDNGRLLRDKARLLRDKARLFFNKGSLLRDKGWLLKWSSSSAEQKRYYPYQITKWCRCDADVMHIERWGYSINFQALITSSLSLYRMHQIKKEKLRV